MEKIPRRAILEIAKTLVGSILQKKDLHQQLLQKFSEILHVGRCVLFQVNDCGSDTYTVEIIAGIPSGEHEHGIGLKGPISQYPDIEAAVRQGKVKVITDPEESPLTDHFRKIIEQKEIR